MRNISLVLFAILFAACLNNEKKAGPAQIENSDGTTEAQVCDTLMQMPGNGKFINGHITDDNLRIRSGPNTSAEIVGLLNTGDCVSVIAVSDKKAVINGTENYWFKIITGNNITGWIFGEYINLPVKEESERFVGATLHPGFGRNLEPKEKITLEDLLSTTWHSYMTLIQFFEEGHYGISFAFAGTYYGNYLFFDDTVFFYPPLALNWYSEKYFIDKLYYSDELHLEGAPVLRNADETFVFAASRADSAEIGSTVKINQHYCTRLREKTKVNVNDVLYALPDVISKNLFENSYHGKKATEASTYKLAETTIGKAVWYYVRFDFTPADNEGIRGPFFEGWLPAEYFK